MGSNPTLSASYRDLRAKRSGSSETDWRAFLSRSGLPDMPASFEEAVDEELERMVLENLDYLDRPGRLAVLNLSEELSPERRHRPKVDEIPYRPSRTLELPVATTSTGSAKL